MVLCRHRYSDQLNIEMMEGQTSRDGRIKGGLNPLDPQDFLWRSGNADALKYYAALLKIRNEHQSGSMQNDMQALKALARNPLAYDYYHHEAESGAHITSASIVSIRLLMPAFIVHISIQKKKHFQELSATLFINGKAHSLADIGIIYRYFIRQGNNFYLAGTPGLVRLISFFKRHDYRIMVPHSSFEHFRVQVLAQLEQEVHITYSHVKPATVLQLAEQGFDKETEWIIYLSEHENHIGITPVVRYGASEIPVLSRKQVYATDNKGNTFLVQRDDKEELQLLSMLVRQHPDFCRATGLRIFLPAQRTLPG